MAMEIPSMFERKPRADGSVFVTAPHFTAFSYILQPSESDAGLHTAFISFLEANLAAARAALGE